VSESTSVKQLKQYFTVKKQLNIVKVWKRYSVPLTVWLPTFFKISFGLEQQKMLTEFLFLSELYH